MTLSPLLIHLSNLVVCFTCSVLASPPSVPSTQRPWLHIQPGWDRRPVWPFWRPHSQPLTPETLVSEWFPNMLIYPHFLPRFCPFAEGKKRHSKANMICWAFKDNSAQTQWAHSDCGSMYSLLKKYSREQNIFLIAFSRKHTQNKWQIYFWILYDKVLCLFISFPVCKRVWAYIKWVCLCVCASVWVLHWTRS